MKKRDQVDNGNQGTSIEGGPLKLIKSPTAAVTSERGQRDEDLRALIEQINNKHKEHEKSKKNPEPDNPEHPGRPPAA